MRVFLYAITVLGAAGVLVQSDYALPDTTPPTHATDLKPHPIASPIRPVDCADHLLAGATASGVYEIYPFTCMCAKPVLVWCDMETDGGGWTVFLSRQQQDIQLDFNRMWNDYKAGFGSPYSEYYLGNEVLHQMTLSRGYAIRMDVTLPSGVYDFATYQRFSVNSESNRYTASLSGTKLEGTSSTDCLKHMHNQAFSTWDRDHDRTGGTNCAAISEGGWWYYNCAYLNPTNPWNRTLSLRCGGSTRRVTELQFKLRPSACDNSFKTIHIKDRSCGCAAPEQ